MPHYYSEKQDSPLGLKTITVSVSGKRFELFSASGIFSKDELDKGTKLLIESAIIEKGWKILDLGCGNGIVGIAMKLLHPDTEVIMSDINERAIMLSSKNIELHHLTGIMAIKSDAFDKIQEQFDTVLLNPPQTAGRDVCYKMIDGSVEHLSKGGLLQIVARHKKGGEMLKRRMAEAFGNVADISSSSGFRVYASRKA